MIKASDIPSGEIFHTNREEIEFPEKMIVRRDGATEIIYTHILPTSMPDVKCHTTKNFGQGVYTLAFVYADGTEKGIHRNLVIADDDRECPFVSHYCRS